MHSQNQYADGALVVPSELTGYRRWTLRPSGLVGNWGTAWEADTLDAVCLDRRWVQIDRDEYLRLLADPEVKRNDFMAKGRDRGTRFYRNLYGEHIPDDIEDVTYSKAVTGRGHEAPHHNPEDLDDDCKCGIYAGYGLEGLQQQWVTSPSNSYVGVVKASGRTICGSVGFRTQRARIVALCVGLDMQTERLFREGRVSSMYVDPSGERVDTLKTEGTTPEERLAELVDKRAAALGRCAQYQDVAVYRDIRDLVRDFPPDDLRALGIER